MTTLVPFMDCTGGIGIGAGRVHGRHHVAGRVPDLRLPVGDDVLREPVRRWLRLVPDLAVIVGSG